MTRPASPFTCSPQLDPSTESYPHTLQSKPAFSRSQLPSSPPPATHLYAGENRRHFPQPAAYPYKEGGGYRAQTFGGGASVPFTRSQAMGARSPAAGSRMMGLAGRDNPRKWHPAHTPLTATSPLFR